MSFGPSRLRIMIITSSWNIVFIQKKPEESYTARIMMHHERKITTRSLNKNVFISQAFGCQTAACLHATFNADHRTRIVNTSKGLTIKRLFMLRGGMKVHKSFVLGLLIFKQHQTQTWMFDDCNLSTESTLKRAMHALCVLLFSYGKFTTNSNKNIQFSIFALCKTTK